jgi:hypothetical protein
MSSEIDVSIGPVEKETKMFLDAGRELGVSSRHRTTPR